MEPGNYDQEDVESGTADTSIPKSILSGKAISVGDKIVLEIKGIYGDEVAVSVADADAPEEPETELEPEGTETQEGEMPLEPVEQSPYD